MRGKISVAVLLFILAMFFSVKSHAAANELNEIKNAISGKNGRWTAGETSFTRLTPDERRSRLGTIIPSKGAEKVMSVPTAVLPTRVDWRNYGGYGSYVTPVKEQGACAGCWAFAPTAALESSVLISRNTPGADIDLSEQVATSCSGVGSCVGGFIDYFSDFIRNVGLPDESCYPYIAADGSCSNACMNWTSNTYKISDWYRVNSNLDAIKYALYNKGPLVATMSVYTDFLYYTSGVYSYAWGNLEGYHSALIVGYDDAGQYFIVKSSWGADWGEAGYSRISYSEINSNVFFGDWTIAYDYPIPADFPTIDGVQRVSIANADNPGDANANGNVSSNGQAATVLLSGVVRDATGAPVAGVDIKIGAYSATTDANGKYSFPAIPSGNHAVILIKAGYSATTVNITLSASQTATKDFIIVLSSANSNQANNQGNASAQANAKNKGPGWFAEQAPIVSHAEADAYFASRKVSIGNALSGSGAPMTGLATDVSPEIMELARALKNDPGYLYWYVTYNIDYVPYYGSLKGATLTLLDGSGNDFDQASLMIALLRASGYTDAQYSYVYVHHSAADLANLFGVDETYQTISNVIANAGIPADVSSDGSADMNLVWVQVTINGAVVYYDPSFKTYSYTNKIDIGQAMGYNQADVMSAVASGATIGSDYVHNLNETALNSKLSTLSSNLVATIHSQYPNSDIKEIIGGRKISTRTSSYTGGIVYSWSEVPNAYIATLRVQHVGIDYTFKIPDLGGRRLTITYRPGGTELGLLVDWAELRLDGALIATSTSTIYHGWKYPLTLTIDHPYAANSGAYADQTVTYTPVSGSSYAIVYDFGGTTDARLHKSQKQLDGYIAQGSANTSESVLGETLNIMGTTWMKEVNMANRLLSALTDIVEITHHDVGLMAQEAGYYIDVKALTYSISSKHNNINSSIDELAHFKASVSAASAFEHGMLEQLMGSDKPAVSTMKLFQLANASANTNANKVFLVNEANWASIRPQLTGYSVVDLDYFANRVALTSAGGYTLVLPQNGTILAGTSTQWKGKGYVEKKFNADGSSGSMGMIIGENNYGGYAASPGPVNIPKLVTTITYMVDNVLYSQTIGQHVTLVNTPTSNEPVDMASGAYIYDHTDLALGSSAPLGLSFARSYNGNSGSVKRTLGYGWAHNYDIRLEPSSDGNPGLGLRQPVDAASFIAALYTMVDIFKTRDDIQGWMTASLASKWAVDQLIDNAVTVNLGGKTMEFVKLADGTYASLPGLTTKLVKTGGLYSLEERFGERTHFNAANLISDMVDVDGNTMNFNYSGSNLSSVTDAFGRSLGFTYDASNRIASVADSAGRSISYSYDASGNLVNYIDPEGKQWGYGYNADHRMTTLINPLNITTITNDYDTLGRVKTQTAPRQGGSNVTYNYYFSGYVSYEQDPAGNWITYYFDEKGRHTATKDALGKKSSKVYDGQDHVVKTIDARSKTTLYEYDGQNNLIKVTDALGKITTNAYDGQYRLVSTTDPLNHAASFAYDSEHHLTGAADALGNTTAATYYTNGFKNTAADARHTTTTLAYDGYGNPSSTTTGSHAPVSYVYDSIGRMTSLTDRVGA
ncbi:MAG: carboxypeptidase regulatory-like domain-containing protein, partial [Planctomycetes bacterium]|nr:carboxypeptidase regulatory-like domain-containing protein [Planctomycetota bacterium]